MLYLTMNVFILHVSVTSLHLEFISNAPIIKKSSSSLWSFVVEGRGCQLESYFDPISVVLKDVLLLVFIVLKSLLQETLVRSGAVKILSPN